MSSHGEIESLNAKIELPGAKASSALEGRLTGRDGQKEPLMCKSMVEDSINRFKEEGNHGEAALPKHQSAQGPAEHDA